MKKAFIFGLFTMLSFVFFNNVVNAEEYVSELTPQNKAISGLSIDKVNLENFGIIKYVKSGTTIGSRYEIIGRFRTEYTENVDIKIKYTFYDINKNPIKEYEADVKIDKEYGASYTKIIYTDQEGFNIDNVKYYILEISTPMEAKIFDGKDTGTYFYEDYVTEVDVKKNNVYNVKESFKGKFKGSSRAVDVYLPFRHAYERNDGTKVNKRAIISDLKVSEDYSTAIEKGNNIITMGKADASKQEKDFAIEYNYNVGKDKLKGHDEFVFYLVKNNPIDINGYSFKITLPSEFNKDNVSVVDEAGNVADNVEFNVEENVITGHFKDMVQAETTYMIKVLLPDKYFGNTTLNISGNTWISFIIPVVFMVITIVVYVVSKRQKNSKNEHVGYYLDEDLDSLELGYVLKNGVKETDISSLAFCLANKGYIKIEFNKDGYKIIKLRDYDGSKKLEEILMNRLFNNKDSVTRKDLRENLKNIKEEIDKYFKYKKKKRFYILPFLNYKLIFWLMMLIIYIVIMNDLYFEYQPSDLTLNVVVGFIGFIIMLVPATSKKYQLIEKMLCIMAGIVLIVSPIILTSYQAFMQDSLYVAAYIIGIVCIVSIAVTSSMMNNRTSYGNYMFRKINSYKSYLVNMSDLEVNEALENNINYFYEVLPFALTMGMSDKFYDKFVGKKLTKPDWYEKNKFDLEDFYTEIKNVYSDFFIAIKNK